MRSEIKYLGIGLAIGLVGTTLLMIGILIPGTAAGSPPTNETTSTAPFFTSTIITQPTTPPPTNTYTPTPTYMGTIPPTRTNTPSPSPTITLTVPSPTSTLSVSVKALFENGHITQVGPLSLEQQILVYQSSIKYIRLTNEDSISLGEEINGKGYGSPTDICGPLSIAILQDAGIVNPNIDPHDFWLLNPDVWDDRYLILRKAFPPEYYKNVRLKTKINKIDWHDNPLFPGDFIYIYAGTGGNFEHMLVVNRVDTHGRAYAVTNLYTPEGFIISEVLLYHPDIPNIGVFPVWTERPNKLEGSTGFGGLEIWRMRNP